MFASAQKLDNLIGFTDYNKLQSDGTIAQINDLAPLAAKWAAFGWNVIDVKDGNNVDEISAAVKQAKANRGSGRPTMVILNTVKGCGVQWIVDLGAASHSCNISEEQLKHLVASKGHYPETTAIDEYSADFIESWAIKHFSQIVKTIKEDI